MKQLSTPLAAAFLFGAAILTPAFAQDQAPTAVLKFYEALNGNPASFAEALKPDWVVHGSSPSIPTMDLATYGKVSGEFFKGMSGFKYKIEDVIVGGEKVTVRGTVTATHGGSLFGLPATNAKIEFGAIDIHRLRDGRIAESWHIEDFTTLLGQIGGLPKTN